MTHHTGQGMNVLSKCKCLVQMFDRLNHYFWILTQNLKMWEKLALIPRGGTIFLPALLSNLTQAKRSMFCVILVSYWRGQSCFVVLLSQNAVTAWQGRSNQLRSETLCTRNKLHFWHCCTYLFLQSTIICFGLILLQFSNLIPIFYVQCGDKQNNY